MSLMSYHRFTAELEAHIVERQKRGLPALENDEYLYGHALKRIDGCRPVPRAERPVHPQSLPHWLIGAPADGSDWVGKGSGVRTPVGGWQSSELQLEADLNHARRVGARAERAA